MTREETKNLLMVIQTAYPTYKPPDKRMAVDLWHAMFADYDFQTVLIALQAYIASDEKGFAPVPGQINGMLNKMKQANEHIMTDMEAWSLVSKALRNSGYHYVEEFEKLPEDVQRAVGSADMLHVWALDENYNEGVVMSQFIKSYHAAIQQREERESLPASVRDLIEDTANKLEG